MQTLAMPIRSAVDIANWVTATNMLRAAWKTTGPIEVEGADAEVPLWTVKYGADGERLLTIPEDWWVGSREIDWIVKRVRNGGVLDGEQFHRELERVDWNTLGMTPAYPLLFLWGNVIVEAIDFRGDGAQVINPIRKDESYDPNDEADRWYLVQAQRFDVMDEWLPWSYHPVQPRGQLPIKFGSVVLDRTLNEITRPCTICAGKLKGHENVRFGRRSERTGGVAHHAHFWTAGEPPARR